jgi:hypothetical protein
MMVRMEKRELAGLLAVQEKLGNQEWMAGMNWDKKINV